MPENKLSIKLGTSEILRGVLYISSRRVLHTLFITNVKRKCGENKKSMVIILVAFNTELML